MLQPRKNPLIDGPVTVAAGISLRRWRLIAALLALAVLGLLLAWPASQPVSSEVSDEVWWRRLVSRIALQRLVQRVDASAVEEMKQRVSTLEAERVSLTERLADSEKLLNTDRSGRRLSQVVLRRDGNDVVFEILVKSLPGSTVKNRLLVDIAPIRMPDMEKFSPKANPLMLESEKSTRLMLSEPKVAETLQGRLPSTASHVLVILTPVGESSQTEAIIAPVSVNR